jgi:DNA gyrase subunit A
MSRIAEEMLADIDKDTVDFIPNYDESLKEPTVLPAKIPNLLVNGSAGIAVGMATNIPPHNLGEVVDGIIMLIDNPDVSIKELMSVIKGPDFPTGGLILGREGIKSAYTTGRGSVKMRAQARIEKMASGKNRILVTEIPYQVNKARLIESIANLVRDKAIEGITDLRDESDRSGMRIVMELRRDANPTVILNQLYKHTQMQETFGVIMLALVDGRPRVLNLGEILHYYIEHQKETITRRTKFELAKARERAHILEGLKIALDHLDAVIATIRASRTVEIARQALQDKFHLSEKQAQAILDMRLQRLTGLEREKIEQEYKDVLETIEWLEAVLADEQKVLAIIKEELQEVKRRFADPRRTVITTDVSDFEVEDLIAEEDIVITLTHGGYIKRLPVDTYRSQRRGGRGVTGMGTKEEDFVEHLFVATTHHNILFFTNRGRVYRLKAYEIPEASRTAKGMAIVNLLSLENK